MHIDIHINIDIMAFIFIFHYLQHELETEFGCDRTLQNTEFKLVSGGGGNQTNDLGITTSSSISHSRRPTDTG